MLRKEIITAEERKTDVLKALELEEYKNEEESKFLLKNNVKCDLVVGKLLGIKRAIEIVEDSINEKSVGNMYIATCTCGNADIERMDNPCIFLCGSCGEALHETELVITTFDEYCEKVK